ncbi:MAG: nucleotidyltransferase domain-containing protein [Paludibacter sp.]|nr:nucleotidyltransferase domain-containing protein [Paludibacter sp.]
MLNIIKRLVIEKDSTAKIYLYGSRAKGNARKDSDWDLLILLNRDKITSDIEKEITNSLYDFEFESGQIISPMVYSEKEWNSKYKITPFYKNVMREGRLL